MRRGARAMCKGHEKRCKGLRIFQNSNWGPCTKLYCLSFWYKDKIYGPCTHQRPLHLFLWPLHISKWPLHPFLFSRFVALAHGPCTSSRGPCTGPCPRKMSLFGRLSGRCKVKRVPAVQCVDIVMHLGIATNMLKFRTSQNCSSDNRRCQWFPVFLLIIQP